MYEVCLDYELGQDRDNSNQQRPGDITIQIGVFHVDDHFVLFVACESTYTPLLVLGFCNVCF